MFTGNTDSFLCIVTAAGCGVSAVLALLPGLRVCRSLCRGGGVRGLSLCLIQRLQLTHY